MGELANCANCGELFVRMTRPICQKCFQVEEEKFQRVYNFIKKRVNREATITEIVAGTGVEEDLIIKFVKENRLRTSQFPNLAYPCDRCGKSITEGKICSSCSQDLARDLEREDEIAKLEQKNVEEKKRTQTYYAVDKTSNHN